MDVNQQIRGESLLEWAIKPSPKHTHIVEVVNLLLQAGSDPNAHSGWGGSTPIFDCTAVPDIIKPLLAAGANIEARDQQGQTPLIWASFNANAVQMLLDAGADPEPVTNNGDTALKRAQRNGCKLCADLIQSAIEKRHTKSTN